MKVGLASSCKMFTPSFVKMCSSEADKQLVLITASSYRNQ